MNRSPITLARRLFAALELLQELIAKGWEYPDAHAKACVKFGIDGDLLAEAYDNAN